VLASASPRRSEILRAAGIRFRAVTPGIDERPPVPLGPLRFVAWAAAAKAEAVAARNRKAVVVAADTEVVLDGRIFGKPADRRQAAEFLQTLSGRTHQVYTAMQLIDGRSGCRAQGVSRTHVTMRELSPRVIAAYLETGEAQDKAGAYAIQGEGRRLIRSIRGPHDNVVGMPMRLLTRLLGECGIPLPANNPDGLQKDLGNRRLKRSYGTPRAARVGRRPPSGAGRRPGAAANLARPQCLQPHRELEVGREPEQ
jgi:septum formation protein